jgi:hypothetical protein
LDVDWADGQYVWQKEAARRSIRIDPGNDYEMVVEAGDVTTHAKGRIHSLPAGLLLDGGGLDIDPRDALIVPFGRGECRYLTRAVDLQAAVEVTLRSHSSPHDPTVEPPSLYVWEENKDHDCRRSLQVPKAYRRSLIQGIDAQELDPHSTEERMLDVVINRGEWDGIWLGLRMRSAAQLDSEWSATVIRMDEHTAVLRMDHAGDPRPLRWTSRLHGP